MQTPDTPHQCPLHLSGCKILYKRKREWVRGPRWGVCLWPRVQKKFHTKTIPQAVLVGEAGRLLQKVMNILLYISDNFSYVLKRFTFTHFSDKHSTAREKLCSHNKQNSLQFCHEFWKCSGQWNTFLLCMIFHDFW